MHAENTMFFEYYVRISALNLGDFVEKKLNLKINVKIYLCDIQYDMGRTVVNI